MGLVKVKSASFNVDDEHQRRIWEYCNSVSNFSAYVKALVFRDMEGAPVVKQEPQQPETDVNSFI